jgi:hypothetical protein
MTWGDGADGTQFRAEVEAMFEPVSSRRGTKGLDKGWTAGVRDANEGEADPLRPKNPYRGQRDV